MKADEARKLTSKGEKEKEKQARVARANQLAQKRRDNADIREAVRVCYYPTCLKAIEKAASVGKYEAHWASLPTTVSSANGRKEGELLKKLLQKDGYTVEIKTRNRDSGYSGSGDDIVCVEWTYWTELTITW